MNLTGNYENLKKAKEELEQIIDEGEYDPITKARFKNVISRISLTLTNIGIEIDERSKTND